jgi:hypothetical protein
MSLKASLPAEFGELRPRLKLLVQMHRAATTDEEREGLEGKLEELFLATAWHVAEDLLENGWRPVRTTGVAPERLAASNLRVVGDDAA